MELFSIRIQRTFQLVSTFKKLLGVKFESGFILYRVHIEHIVKDFPHLLNALQQDVKSRQTLLPVNYLIAINGCCLIVFSLSPTLFLDYNWLKAIKFTFVFLSFTKLFEVIQHLHRFGSRPPIPALIIRNIKIHFRHGMYIFQFNRIFIHFHRILLDYTKITHLLIPNK